MTEQTVQHLFNLWFFDHHSPSKQQFSNLYSTTIAILKYFNKEGKFDEEIEIKLPALFFDPISELREKYPESKKLPKNIVDWSIPQLESLYHRETNFKIKLGEEYFIDSRKEQEKKKITLAEIVNILALFKVVMFEKIVSILIEQKLDIIISFPGVMNEIKQVGGNSNQQA